MDAAGAIRFVGQIKRNQTVDLDDIAEATDKLRRHYSIRQEAMRAHGVDDAWFLSVMYIRPEDGRDQLTVDPPPQRLDRHDRSRSDFFV